MSEILKINERNSKSRGGACGRAGSLAICNCSVCSLQQPPLQIIGALEVMGDFFFFFLSSSISCTTLQVSDSVKPSD